MGKTLRPEFTHRINKDGSIQSYCSQCFATVSDAGDPKQLQSAEREHRCDSRLVEMVEKYRSISRLRSVA